jgi:hypothetical protein
MFVASSELGPPPPPPQASVSPPLDPKEVNNTRLRVRGLEEPNRTTGQKARHSVYSVPRDGILGHHFNKDSRLLLRAIHSPFYWRILQKTILF